MGMKLHKSGPTDKFVPGRDDESGMKFDVSFPLHDWKSTESSHAVDPTLSFFDGLSELPTNGHEPASQTSKTSHSQQKLDNTDDNFDYVTHLKQLNGSISEGVDPNDLKANNPMSTYSSSQSEQSNPQANQHFNSQYGSFSDHDRNVGFMSMDLHQLASDNADFHLMGHLQHSEISSQTDDIMIDDGRQHSSASPAMASDTGSIYLKPNDQSDPSLLGEPTHQGTGSFFDDSDLVNSFTGASSISTLKNPEYDSERPPLHSTTSDASLKDFYQQHSHHSQTQLQRRPSTATSISSVNPISIRKQPSLTRSNSSFGSSLPNNLSIGSGTASTSLLSSSQGTRRGSLANSIRKKTITKPSSRRSSISLNQLNNDPGDLNPTGGVSDLNSKADTKCSNCHTKTTPLWRRDPQGNPLCNACGLFLKLHGVVRPLSLKTDVIKKRQRSSNKSKQSSASLLTSGLSSNSNNNSSSESPTNAISPERRKSLLKKKVAAKPTTPTTTLQLQRQGSASPSLPQNSMFNFPALGKNENFGNDSLMQNFQDANNNMEGYMGRDFMQNQNQQNQQRQKDRPRDSKDKPNGDAAAWEWLTLSL